MPKESAGGVIVGPEGKIVLVEQNGNSWAFPKGGVEEGETLLEAARREIKEETGLTELMLLGELGSYKRYSIGLDGIGEQKERESRKRSFFLFKTNQTELEPQDDEVTEGRWVTIDEALAMLTHPKDRKFLQSVRKRVEEALQ